MTDKAAALTQEVCAIIGTGLFAFGLWKIYPPAAFLFAGLILAIPFAFSLRRVK